MAEPRLDWFGGVATSLMYLFEEFSSGERRAGLAGSSGPRSQGGEPVEAF